MKEEHPSAVPRGPAVGAIAAWEALARSASEGQVEADAQDRSRQLLAFDLRGVAYALPMESVREIVRLRPITPIPRVPEEIRGVISLRGEIVQVIDVRCRLGIPPGEPTRANRILLVRGADDTAAGLLVDAVTEVLRVPEDALRPPVPGESEAVEAMFRRGDQFVSVIALEKLLDIHAES